MFENKTLFIVGASTGLGRALSIKLASKNPNMALMSRNIAGLKETASLCKTNPLLIPGDITSESDCQAAIERIIQHYGRLDHLILNAGMSMWSTFEELPNLAAISQLMQTNYMGAVHCTYYALPYLKKTNGMITVISSIQGKVGVPYHTGYAASKHALEGFFNSLRIELNNQIKVLIVSPGWIKGTELKQRALGKQKISKEPSKEAISLDDCCNEIISAITKRKRELVIPKKYRLLAWLKIIMPALLDRLINRKI
jgi:short-subunit dehydrogenase